MIAAGPRCCLPGEEPAHGQRQDTPGRVVSLVGPHAAVLPSDGSSAPHCADGRHSQTPGRNDLKLANIKSQKKRVLTNAKAAAANKSVRSGVKTAVKKVNEAIAAGDKAAALASLQAANRELDRAATKGVIHKNQAANRKSGIASAVAKMAD